MLTTRRIVTIGATAAALVAPSAAAAQQVNLVSPDARDAGRQSHVVTGPDLRTPDAREAADRRIVATPVAPAPDTSPQSQDAGFQWGDAGIGAAGMLGVVGIVAGLASLLLRRRRHGVAVPSS